MPDNERSLPESSSKPRVRAPETCAGLQLALFGTFELRGGRPGGPTLPKKAQALLAYVAALPARSVAREHLATLLWGDHGTEQARRSLRQCLMSIRAAPGPGLDHLLVDDVRGAQIALSQDIEVDVRQFEILARSTRREDIESACRLYRDELLAGLHISSEPFNEWLATERRRLSAIMSDALIGLASLRARDGDLRTAIETAQRLTAFDPLREDGHRLLLQLLAAAGRRSAALKQHALYVDLLRRELGVAPEPATAQLADQIRAGRCQVPGAQANASGPLPDLAAVPSAAASGGSAESAVAATDGCDQTSIAVLPFANQSDDREQDYLADGMSEDITNALGRVPWLFVIASSSTLAYRGRPGDIRQIGRDLSVRYLLRGSVRRCGKRVRITVQLLDAARAVQVWCERFEDAVTSIFEIQDRVAAETAAMIAPRLHSLEIERAQRKGTANLNAYELYLSAVPKFRRSPAENAQALQLLRRAMALDPSYAAAFALAARCYHFQKVLGWAHPADPRLQEGVRLARVAGETGRNDSEALWMAGLALVFLAGELEHGGTLIERSLSLNPNSANAWIASCFARAFLGESATAIEHFARAQRINPLDTMHHLRWNALANVHFLAGRYDEAARLSDRTLAELPTYPSGLRMKIATCGLLGRGVEGREYVDRLLSVNPDASVSTLRVFWEPLLRRNPGALDAYLRGLRLAGLPE